MTQRTGWFIRRLQRTGWLLRERETRADTVHYLLGKLVDYSNSFGHQAIDLAIAGLVRATRAR